MIANSTNISNRMFRTQRFVILMILAAFVLLLIITAAGGHEQIKNKSEVYNKASEKLTLYFGEAYNKLSNDAELEKEAEEQELKDAKEKEEQSNKAAQEEAQVDAGDSTKPNHQKVDTNNKKDIRVDPRPVY